MCKKKSHLTPSRDIVHLGAKIQTRIANVSLPAAKIVGSSERNLVEVGRLHALVDSTGADDVVHRSDSLGPLPCQVFTMDSYQKDTYTHKKGSLKKILPPPRSH